MTFVAVENKRGYIIHRCDQKGLANTAGEPVLEQVECPEGVVVSSAGLPDADLPQLTRPPGVACTSPGASTLKAKNPRAAGRQGGRSHLRGGVKGCCSGGSEVVSSPRWR